MPIYYVETAITGSAYVEIHAESAEHALDMYNSGDADLELVEWNSCTDSYRGGYLSITESDCKVVDEVFEEE